MTVVVCQLIMNCGLIVVSCISLVHMYGVELSGRWCISILSCCINPTCTILFVECRVCFSVWDGTLTLVRDSNIDSRVNTISRQSLDHLYFDYVLCFRTMTLFYLAFWLTFQTLLWILSRCSCTMTFGSSKL